MPRPTSRSDSSRQQLNVRVPADVRVRASGRRVVITFPPAGSVPEHTVSALVGDFVRFSLGTADVAIGRQRHGLALGHLEALWPRLRSGPGTLSQLRINALSGEVYRLFVGRFQENPGTPDVWAAVKAFNRAAREGRTAAPPVLTEDLKGALKAAHDAFGSDLTAAINGLPRQQEAVLGALEARFGWLVDWVLSKHGEVIDDESRARLLASVERAATDAALRLKRNADDDYSPDPAEARFAPVTTRSATPLVRSFSDIYQSYENVPGKHGARTERTRRAYRTIFVEEFGRFMREHRKLADPLKVARADVAAWRDSLTAAGLSAKTISDKKLACVRAVYERQVNDGALPVNPAAGALIKVARRRQERERGFNDSEAARILKASLSVERGRLSVPVYRALRWLPWIMAYSGARVAEAAQLRGSDFRQDASGWAMRITPEAGSTKTGDFRDVPIHPDLVRRGLIDMVRSAGDGPLFINGTDSREGNAGRARTTSGRLSEWVRNAVGVDDPAIQPNHGWRHRFTTRARAAGLDHEKREYILGHRLPGLGSTYGDMAGLRAEMEKLPPEPVEG